MAVLVQDSTGIHVTPLAQGSTDGSMAATAMQESIECHMATLEQNTTECEFMTLVQDIYHVAIQLQENTKCHTVVIV